MEFFFNPRTGRVEQRQVNNNLPFRSMTELASEINQFPFLPPSPTIPLDAFKNTVAPRAVNTGINNTTPAAMFLDNAGLPGIDTSFRVANEPDVEQVKSIGEEKTGIASLLEFLQKYSPLKAGAELLGRVLDFKDSPNYIPAPMGVYGYTPQQLDKMNALGGYYSDPMRAYRRNTQRISNMLRRAAAGKSYSRKNLDKLLNQTGLGDVDTDAMIDSIAKSGNVGYGIGDVGGGDTGLGAGGGGRDYSSSPGAMAGDMEYGEE